MNEKSLLCGEKECNSCHGILKWSVNIEDPEVKILGGFVNNKEAGNEIEITIQCNQCKTVNKIYDKYLVALI